MILHACSTENPPFQKKFNHDWQWLSIKILFVFFDVHHFEMFNLIINISISFKATLNLIFKKINKHFFEHLNCYQLYLLHRFGLPSYLHYNLQLQITVIDEMDILGLPTKPHVAFDKKWLLTLFQTLRYSLHQRKGHMAPWLSVELKYIWIMICGNWPAVL